MKRRLLTVKFLVFLLASGPRFAHASIADWLDKLEGLSGPGPFHRVVSLSVDVACRELHWEKQPLLPATALKLTVLKTLLEAAQSATMKATVLQATAKYFRDHLPRLRSELPIKEAVSAQAEITPPPFVPTDVDAKLLQDLVQAVTSENDLANDAAVLATVEYFQKIQLWREREDKLRKGQDTGETNVFNPFCTGDLRQPRVNFGVFFGYYTTDKLPDDYKYTPERQQLSPEIHAFPLAATFNLALPLWFTSIRDDEVRERHRQVTLRSLEFGAAAGRILFVPQHSDTISGRFDSFSLWYFEIPRITYRPFAWIACRESGCPGHWTGWDLFEVGVVGKWIGSVDPEQFGAEPGVPSGKHFYVSPFAGISFKINR
jgi:hypothetical protein